MTIYSVTAYYLAPIYVQHDIEAQTPAEAIAATGRLEEQSAASHDMPSFWADDNVDVESGGETCFEVREPGEGQILASRVTQEIAPAGTTELLQAIDQDIVTFAAKHGAADADLDNEAVWELMKAYRDRIQAVLSQ